MPTSIAIVDDHHLVAEAFADLIGRFEGYQVQLVAENGYDLLRQLQQCATLPDIALVDLSMPEMDGFETALQLRQLYPSVRVLALSMDDRKEHIISMVQNGARGYLLKGCRPAELRRALDDVMQKGFYYSDFLTQQLIRNIISPEPAKHHVSFDLNDRETEFLKLACSELTYTEIADRMCVSPRTVDGYREAVFQKMNVKTRVVMALEAVRHRLIVF